MRKNKKRNTSPRITYKKKDGKLIIRRKDNNWVKEVKEVKKPSGEYLRYLNKAKELKLPKNKRFDEPTYYSVVTIGNLKKDKIDFSPETIAFRQTIGGLTENQLDARYRIAQKKSNNTYKNREDFIKREGWKDVDDEIARISDENPNLSSEQLQLLITRLIFSPE